MTKRTNKELAADGGRTGGGARSEALAWYVERMDGELSVEDEARFEDWLLADPAHQREYRQLDQLCDRLGAFGNAAEVAEAKAYAARFQEQARRAGVGDADGGAATAAAKGAGGFLAMVDGTAGAADAPGRESAVSPRRWQGLVAASLALLAAVWLVANSDLFRPESGHFETVLGERETVRLADGSSVELNTSTAIEVFFSAGERRIRLQNGQASFDVAPDASRPFVVEAGEGTVTAIGTEFEVYKSGSQVTVTLIEGRVEVRGRASEAAIEMSAGPALEAPEEGAGSDPAETLPTAAPEAAELAPGERVSIGGDGRLSAVAEIDIDRAEAWRAGEIELHLTPLREAIAEVNRYSRVKLVLIDSALGDVEVSGIFKAGEPENFVHALEARFGLRADRIAPDRILLKPPLPS